MKFATIDREIIVKRIGRLCENEESCPISGAVGQHAQHAEKPGHYLDFVNDHETSQGAEHEFRVLQAGYIEVRFKVEAGSASIFGKHAGEGCFPALSGTDERRDW